jgi:hypothetical protein
MCECKKEQDFDKCNCVGLFKVSYSHKGKDLVSEHKFRDIVNFIRYCEISNLPHKEYKNLELI